MIKLLFLLNLCILISSLNVSILFSNTTVSATDSYQVTITRTNSTLLSTSTITFTFDSGSYDLAQLSSLTCSPTCVRNNYTLSIPGSSFTASPTVFKFNISNVVNPPSTRPPSYTYRLADAANNTIESQSVFPQAFIPGAFKSCSISFSPNSVSNNATAILSITPGSPAPIGGYLLIRLPNQWSNPIDNSTVLSSSLICSSPSPPLLNPSCNLLLTGMIRITSFLQKSTSAYTLSLSPILTPPTVAPQSTVFISSFDSQMYFVDNYTFCTMQALEANVFSVSNTTDATVAGSFQPLLRFNTTDKVAIGDVMRVAVGGEVDVGSVGVLGIRVMDEFGAVTSLSVGVSAGQTDQAQKIYGYVLPKIGSISPLNKNVQFQLTGLTFLASPTVKTIEAFKITFSRNNSLYSTGTSYLTPLPDLLKNISISAANPLVGVSTSYTITFSTSSALTSVGYVQVILPYELVVSGYSNQSCTVMQGNSASNAVCSLGNGTLTVLGLFAGAVAANSTVSVRFSGVTNPLSERPTSSFTISTFYTNSTDVTDQGFATFTASSDTIVSCTVSRSVGIVGQSSVYTFLYTVKNTLPAATNIIIVLPSFITTYTNTTVTISLNGSIAQSRNATINTQQVNITSPYLSTVLPGTLLRITVSSLMNPNSTLQPSSFFVGSYDGIYLVEKISTGVVVGPATTANFTQAQIVASNSINGESANYTLTFQSSITYQSSVVLRLQVPAQIGIPSNVSCFVVSGFTNSTFFSNVINGTSIQISIQQPINSSVVYKLTINNLTNPRTLTQSSAFGLVSMLPNLTASIDSSPISGITNTLPNGIVNFTMKVVSPTQSYLNSSQTIQFTVVTKNALLSTDYLELTYPREYTYVGIGNGSVCIQSAYSCFPNSNNLWRIKITSSSFNNTNNLTFQVQGYLSPISTSNLTYFTINTFDSKLQAIDQTNTSNPNTQIYFTASCQSTCQTCNSSNLTQCLSCYRSSISIYMFLSNQTCVSVCADGFYGDATSQSCLACVSPCLTCTNNILCLSCVNTSTNRSYDSFSKKCVALCPNGTFSNLSSNLYVCSACASTCLTCSNLATNCTSCSSPYFLSNFTCISSCPNGTFGLSNLCQACDVSCLTCQVNSTTCIACADNYVWSATIAKACTNDCGNMVASKGKCQCDSKCLTCSVVIENCTSCNPNVSLYANYFFNNSVGQCIQFCPSGSYLTNRTCLVCPQGCRDCLNSSYCTSCIGTYGLMNNKCLNSCGDGYYILANVCQNCSNTCKTCVDVSQKCTSCVLPLMLQQIQCVTNCTVGIPITTNGSIVCMLCSENCQTCVGAIDNCISCSSGMYLYNNKCYVVCPNTTYPNVQICSDCENPCKTCNLTGSQCTSCVGNFLLQLNECVGNCSDGYFKLNSQCVTKCPDNMIGMNRQCVDIVDTQLNTTKIVPVPFTIAAVVAGIVVGVSKCTAKETSLPLMATAILSILETLVWIVAIILAGVTVHTPLVHSGLICLAVAIGLHFAINIVALVFFFKYIKTDENFIKWYNRFATLGFVIPLYLLSSINHKFLNIIFSRCFGSRHFKAPLSLPSSFTPLAICTCISVVPQLLAITSSILFLKSSSSSTTLLSPLSMLCIDCLVVTGLTIVFSAWSLYKPTGYFEQDKKYIVDEVVYQSQYNQTMGDINGEEEEIGVGCVPIQIRLAGELGRQGANGEEVDGDGKRGQGEEGGDESGRKNENGRGSEHIVQKTESKNQGEAEREGEDSRYKSENKQEVSKHEGENNEGEQVASEGWENVEEIGQSAAPPPIVATVQANSPQKQSNFPQSLPSNSIYKMESQIQSIQASRNKINSNRSSEGNHQIESIQSSIVNKVLTKSCVKEFETQKQVSNHLNKTEPISHISQINLIQPTKSQKSSISQIKPIKSQKSQSIYLQKNTQKQLSRIILQKSEVEKQTSFGILGESHQRTTENIEFTSPFKQDNGPEEHIDSINRTDYMTQMLAMPSFRTGDIGRQTRISEMAGQIIKNLPTQSQLQSPQPDKLDKIPQKPHLISRSNGKFRSAQKRRTHRSPTNESQDFWRCDNWGIFVGPLSPSRDQRDVEPEHPHTTALDFGNHPVVETEQNPMKIFAEEGDILSNINYEDVVANDRRRQSYNPQPPQHENLSKNDLPISAKAKALQKIYLQINSSKRRNRSSKGQRN